MHRPFITKCQNQINRKLSMVVSSKLKLSTGTHSQLETLPISNHTSKMDYAKILTSPKKYNSNLYNNVSMTLINTWIHL